jgi:hypothetical protein
MVLVALSQDFQPKYLHFESNCQQYSAESDQSCHIFLKWDLKYYCVVFRRAFSSLSQEASVTCAG